MKEKAVMPYGMVAEDLMTTLKAKKMKENAMMSNGMVAEDLMTTEDLRTMDVIKSQTMRRATTTLKAEDLRTVKIIHRQTESAKNPATEDLRKMKIQAKAKRKKKTTNHEFNCDVVCLAKRLVHLHLA